jgi:hypothetical protein
MAGPRLVARARPGRREAGDVHAAELPALDERIARGDLLEHARRRIAGAQQIQAEMTESGVGARLGDDRAHPRRDVDAARAHRHLTGRDRDAEHARALAPADQREGRELDAEHHAPHTSGSV